MALDIDDLEIGIIGAGRLGKALALLGAQKGLKVTAVASREEKNAVEIAGRIEGCRVTDGQGVAEQCDLIFVTTPDNLIEQVASSIQWRKGSYVVHCSGATEISALDKAKVDGAQTGGFHPLQSFGDPEVSIHVMPGSTITIEAERPLNEVLTSLASRLGCHVNQIPPGKRALYHAAAGYTSQFIHVLFHEACRFWESWGADRESAVRALLPLAQGTLASIAAGGMVSLMPGPVSRGDTDSVSRHLDSIAGLDPGAIRLYTELCSRTVDISLENNRINHDQAEHFRTMLEKFECVKSSAPVSGKHSPS